MSEPTFQPMSPLQSPGAATESETTLEPVCVAPNHRQHEPKTPPATPSASSGTESLDKDFTCSSDTAEIEKEDCHASVGNNDVALPPSGDETGHSEPYQEGNDLTSLDTHTQESNAAIDGAGVDSTTVVLLEASADAGADAVAEKTTSIENDSIAETVVSIASDAVDSKGAGNPSDATEPTEATGQSNIVAVEIAVGDSTASSTTTTAASAIVTTVVDDTTAIENVIISYTVEDATAIENVVVANLAASDQDTIHSSKFSATVDSPSTTSVESSSVSPIEQSSVSPIEIIVVVETPSVVIAESASVTTTETITPLVTDTLTPSPAITFDDKTASTEEPSTKQAVTVAETTKEPEPVKKSQDVEQEPTTSEPPNIRLEKAIKYLSQQQGVATTLEALKLIQRWRLDKHLERKFSEYVTAHPGSDSSGAVPAECGESCSRVVSPRASFIADFFRLSHPRCSVCLDIFYEKGEIESDTTVAPRTDQEYMKLLLDVLASVPVCRYPSCARFRDWSQAAVEVFRDPLKTPRCVWSETCQERIEPFEELNPLTSRAIYKDRMCTFPEGGSSVCDRIVLTTDTRTTFCHKHNRKDKFVYSNKYISVLSVRDFEVMLGLDTDKSLQLREVIHDYFYKMFAPSHAENAAQKLLYKAREVPMSESKAPRVKSGFLYTFDYTKSTARNSDGSFTILIKIGHTVSGHGRFRKYKLCNVRDKPTKGDEAPTPLSTFPHQEHPHAKRHDPSVGCVLLFENIIHSLYKKKVGHSNHFCGNKTCKATKQGHKEIFSFVQSGSDYDSARKAVLDSIEEVMRRWEPFVTLLGSDMGASCLYYALQRVFSSS